MSDTYMHVAYLSGHKPSPLIVSKEGWYVVKKDRETGDIVEAVDGPYPSRGAAAKTRNKFYV